MKTGTKVLMGLGSMIVLALIAVTAFWFSVPKEQRNMILFMAGSNETYENYEDYQPIDTNDYTLEASFDVYLSTPDEGDTSVNIQTVAGPLKNSDSSMLKIGRVETIGVDTDNGWQVLADEIAGEDGYPLATSPLSYYTTGLATNLHTQVIDAAAVLDVEIDSVTVEVMNTFRWNEKATEDGQGFLDVSYTNILIDSDASSTDVQAVVDLALNGWAAGNALADQTEVIPHLIINGDHFETYSAIPVTSSSHDSYVGDIN